MSLNVKNLRSGVVGKKPTAEQMAYGQIAINYAKGNEQLFIKNSDDEIVSFYIGDHVKLSAGDSMVMTGDGTTASPYVFDVKLSTTADNALIIDSEGLFVRIGEAAITAADTNDVTMAGDGTAAAPLKATIVIDPVAGNKLTSSETGLKVIVDEVEINVDDTDAIKLEGDGATATPLKASLVVDPVAGNRLTVSATGAKVEAELPAVPDTGDDLVLSVDDAGDLVWVSTDPGEF